MNRRQANKHLLCALAAPFGLPVLSQSSGRLYEAGTKKPYLFKKSTLANKAVQHTTRSSLIASLGNIGIPSNHISVGFPLRDVRVPTWEFVMGIEEIGLGSPFADELLGGFDPQGLMNQFNMMNESNLMNLNQEQLATVLKLIEAMELKPPSKNNSEWNDTWDAAGVYYLVLGTATLNPVMIGGGIGFLWRPMQDDDDDGFNNWEDAYPEDSSRHVVAPDMDGDGIPDDVIYGPILFLRDSLHAAGASTHMPEDTSAAISFTANESSLVIDVALTVEDNTTALRMTYK